MNSSTILIVLCLFVATTNALSCFPECRPEDCPKIKCRKGVSHVKGICGCCDVCSKQNGESCGGLWGIEGECDPNKSLVCAQKPLCSSEDVDHINPPAGVCIPKYEYKIIKKYCKRNLVCPIFPSPEPTIYY